MKKRLMQFAAAALTVALLIPAGWAARVNQEGETMIRVGLASSSSHNATGELAAAHLQNETGFGAGYRFGYYDSSLDFVELARTDSSIMQVAVLKTENLYYGHSSALGKYTYGENLSGNIAVGCYHIQLPGAYVTYRDAAADAEIFKGFVAWINGTYQVRVGAYLSKGEAERAQEAMGQGTIVGTSAYGVSVVETGTDRVLFQFDCGASQAFGILPDVTGASDVQTWFSGYKYRGGFAYQRVSGGNLTVVNVVELEDYTKGVVCYEMGREWPLEALKAQAICARSYALRRLNTHNNLGFDLCNSDWCQVYRGAGSGRPEYGPSATSDQAVEETTHQVLWYNDSVADTYFSASHGGASEDAYYIWGTDTKTEYPYLKGVIDPYEQDLDDANPQSPWTVTYTAAELTKRVQSRGYGTNTSLDHLELTYSKQGNVIQAKLCYTNGQSNTFTPRSSPGIRSIFDVKSIRFTVNGQTAGTGGTGSSSGESGFTINGSEALDGMDGKYVISGTGSTSKAGSGMHIITGTGTTSPLEFQSSGSSNAASGEGTVTVSGSSYVFSGAGNGHSVGMSQFGANAMARRGFTYDEIVTFYFPGTRVGVYQ
ncbi:MAG: SpoIID/LytB domain-containing protein [Lawsonibacter sp.]|nr:SpoIID/LytB domain-containing protein [Lawsonibacter sp.]